MVRVAHVAFASVALAGMLAVSAPLQAQQVYRYQDATGRTIYSDRAPPPSATNVESKRLSENYIETDPLSLEAKRAVERYPVTLYTFACGDTCTRAEALLAKRGVPHKTIIVTEAKGAAQLKELTGDQQAPVLQAGDKLIAKGFNDNAWQSMLDTAGYPKSAPMRRQTTPAVETARNTVAPPAAPAPAPAAVVGTYPKD